MSKTRWSSGKPNFVLMLIFVILTCFFCYLFLASDNFEYLVFCFLSALFAFYLYYISNETSKESREISDDLAVRGFLIELTNVSTINCAEGVDFLGFFVGDIHYYAVSVKGDYEVLRIPYGDHIDYYRYKFLGSGIMWLAIVDKWQKPDKGGVRVYRK